ncbi:MAG: hypothetical protein JWQ89_2000 [Devosia sp.]|uniref:hypothetical protein n=1 Tax=Devosia sp. TaxID=1871048 RepID=UPI002613E067|nr:hypothetical protein [Devosia sp.]MDB5540273.1 hypothetical protein [Devosia sp.]
MDWLRDFQQSLREPVFWFLSTFWPVVGVVVLAGLGWLVASATVRNRGVGGDGSTDAFSDSDGGDGGDDGGGD